MSKVELEDKSIDSNRKTTSLSALGEDILTVLLGRELYGLQISKAIEESSYGQRKIGVGSLYPTLRRLEKKGFIISHWETKEGDKQNKRSGARRRYYRITPAGSKALSDNRCFRDNLVAWQPC